MRCNQLHILITKVTRSYMLVQQTKHDNYMTCILFLHKKVQSEIYLTVSRVQLSIFCLYLDTVNKIHYSNCSTEFRTPPKYNRITRSHTNTESKKMCNITKYLSRNKTSQYVTGNQIKVYCTVLLKCNMCYEVTYFNSGLFGC